MTSGDENVFKFNRPKKDQGGGEESEGSERVVSDMNSVKPFQKTAREYLRKGWSPMPLPEKKKFPPPTGYTGYHGKIVEADDLVDWFSDEALRKANIGLHLTDSGADWTVVGVDVDAYDGKVGEESLEWLEESLGALPPTWTSSSRNDGVSGIRFYRAPAGLKYMGLLRKSVDFIQAGHRYAVVYPSFHPKGGRYGWYNPGRVPEGEPDNEIPSVIDLPELPPEWVDHATKGRRKLEDFAIDKDSTPDDLYDWMEDTFQQPGGERYSYLGQGDLEALVEEQDEALREIEDIGCGRIRQGVAKFINEAGSSEDSHDVLIRAHWSFISLGKEGHHGWMAAMRAFEAYWKRHVFGDPEADPDGVVSENGKRGMSEAVMEIFRSRTEAIRKIKSQIDRDLSEEGGRMNTVASDCPCVSAPEGGWNEGIDDSEFVGLCQGKDPEDYERTDDGNAEHFLDILGENFRYLPQNKKWIHFDQNPFVDRFGRSWPSDVCGGRWVDDSLGLSRRAWRIVQKRQRTYAKQLMNVALAILGGDPENAEGKNLKREALLWSEWADRSGNNAGAKGALEAAQSFPGVSIPFTGVNATATHLGVANGVLELRRGVDSSGSFVLRPGRTEDLINKNTNVPYLSLSDQLSGKYGPEIYEGALLWADYLDTFLANMDLRKWVQQLMGYCLLGLNEKRKIIFLYGPSSTGKSTMLDAVMSALGGYGSTGTMEIFSSRIENPMLVQSVDSRVVTMSEIENADGKTSSATMKKIGSTDIARARELYSNEVIEKKVAFTTVIATNNPPSVDRTDGALDRRIVVVPFNHAVSAREEDPEKGAAIPEKCAAAVLAWMVEGWAIYCKELLKNEPTHLESVRESDEQFKNEMTPLGDFISEYLERTGDPEDKLPNFLIYRAYERYCKDQKIQDSKKWDSRRVSNELKSAGIESSVKPAKFPELTTDNKPHRYKFGVRMKKEVEGNVVQFKHKPV